MVKDILKQIREHMLAEGRLQIAQEFGLDAPEALNLVAQAMIINEQREIQSMLDDIRTILLYGLPSHEVMKEIIDKIIPTPEWKDALEKKLHLTDANRMINEARRAAGDS